MSTKKFPPHKRLRRLRELLDLTQKEFAQSCGYCEQYIVMIEIGERPMSSAFAAKAYGATGIGPLWLLGKEGDDSRPLTETSQPYSAAGYQRKRAAAIKMDSGPNCDQLSDIHHLTHELTTLMEAACRRQQFGMAKYHFRQMADTMTKQLKLKRAINNDRLDALERYLFAYQPKDAIYEGYLTREQRDALWELISPTGARIWARAFSGNSKDSIPLRNQLGRLIDLIIESVTSPARKPLKRAKND